MRETKVISHNANQIDFLVKSIVKGLQEKKGEEILLMDLRKCKNSVADYFILATGNSRTQVEALARSVDEMVNKETGEDPWHTEGLTNGQWVLIDYVNVVVHIFQSDTRNFYNLEGVWADAETKTINEPY